MLNQLTSVSIIDGQDVLDDILLDFTSPPVYEVIRVINGIPLFLQEHFDRLTQSSRLSGIDIQFSEADLLEFIANLVKKTGITNNNIRLEVGKTQSNQTSWVLFWVHSVYPEREMYGQGVKTVTYKAIRENPHAKIFRSDFTQTIMNLRKEMNAFEVLLVNENEIVTEGSRSNLFFIKENTLYSAKEEDVLQGITRLKLIELLHQKGIAWKEIDIPVNALNEYEACFITGTSIHLLPVAMIDDISYPSAKHPLLRYLQSEFNKIVTENLDKTMRRTSQDD